MAQKPESKASKRYIQSFSIVGILAVLCIGLYVCFSKPNPPISTTAAAPVTPEITINELAHSDFPTLTNVTETTSDLRMPYTLQYIMTGHAEPDARIKEDISLFKQQYRRMANDAAMNNLTVQMDAALYREHFYSFTLHKRILQHDAQVSSEVKHYFYDAEAATFVSFKKLLAHNEAHLAKVATLVRQTVEQTPQFAVLLQSPFTQANYIPRWEHFQHFTLTNDTLTFSFITNGKPAIIDLPLPIASVNNLLAPRYQLPLPKMENVIPADYVLDHSKKRVALTFDDGPHEQVTPQILDILKKYDAKATFYVLGQKVQKNPQLAKRIVEEGHEIGNHTWSHPDLVKQTDAVIVDEYKRTTDAITKATGALPSSFRAPYGSINHHVASLIPLKNVRWSIDTLDWKHRNADATVNIVNAKVQNNAIILMHDIHQPTADALERVLMNLQEAGYEMVTISEVNAYLQ